MNDQLSKEQLAKLKEAGVVYPWGPRQTLRLLEAMEKAADNIRRHRPCAALECLEAELPPRNQCDGCARDLPVDANGNHRDAQGISGLFACTAHRYDSTLDEELAEKEHSSFVETSTPKSKLGVLTGVSYRNRKNGRLYVVLGFLVSSTNGRHNGEVLVRYRREGGKCQFARLETEFVEKFTLATHEEMAANCADRP